MKMLLVLQLICLVFLSGGQAETLGANVEGSSYAEVEEILLGAQVEQLRKENLNLVEKIQIQDKQLENMRTLEIINKNLTQENIENMNKIVQLTKTIEDLHNATMQERKFESLLQAELQSKSTHKEDARLERQRHEITKQELEDLKALVKISMNLTRIQNMRASKLENITASMDMDQTIREMKEKEILYLADIQAYQSEILILHNATYEENYQKESLNIAMTLQNQLGERNERLVRYLISSIVNMTLSEKNCTTKMTDAQQIQIDALLENEDTMKQLITQCSMFNASSIALQNHYIQVNSQLKDQLGIKNNVIRHHIEENKERSNDLEETKQLTKIQSEALEIMTEEMERFIPDDFNSRTLVRRSADGIIKSATLCQCIPEAPEASELELTSIEWSCPRDKAIIRNGSQIENTISLPCSISDCSMEESSWAQCEDVLEKSWSPWEYLSCKEIGVGNESILCGSGHRSRSREVRSSSANSWRNESVTEQCQHCSLSFASISEGQKITITPPALGNALNNSMNISKPIPRSDCFDGIEKTTMHVGSHLVDVRCSESGDMSGSWTMIQRRGQYGNAEDMFYQPWAQYEAGFGSLDNEFWLGLKNIADITKEGQWQLQVDLTDWDGKKYFARYDTFNVGPAPKYQLNVQSFDGKSTLGDSLMARHNGKPFTTLDNDQDNDSGNCAQQRKGGWWYDNCTSSNLNGLNYAQQVDDLSSIAWYNGKTRGTGMKSWQASVIKIRKTNI